MSIILKFRSNFEQKIKVYKVYIFLSNKLLKFQVLRTTELIERNYLRLDNIVIMNY